MDHEKYSVTALETIVESLELSDKKRADLLVALRKLKMLDENDPLLKMTLAIGIMTKLIAETPEKLHREKMGFLKNYQNISETYLKTLIELNKYLQTLQGKWTDSVALWEFKEKVFGKEREDYSRAQNLCLDRLQGIVKAVKEIQESLCLVSFGNIMISAITTLLIIVILKKMGWL